MERKVGIGSLVTVSGVSLIAVTKLSFNCQRIGNGVFCFGLKQPVSVVLVSETMRKALSVTGEEISLDQLMQEAPTIKELAWGHQPYNCT